MKQLNETIAAQATVSGEGGIAVIRLSGEDSLRILESVFSSHTGQNLVPRRLTYGSIEWQGERVDKVMAVEMHGPKTYTGEDMAEIHCHGSQYIVSQILSVLVQNGARLAEPGEFTYRAFMNGRVDLSQAEAVMRLIHASSDRAHKSALRQMDGAVSAFVEGLQSDLLDMSAAISAAIDFPDEVEEAETRESIQEKCIAMLQKIESNISRKNGRIEDDGVFVALCGKPNAGKSSLLNRLVGQERAIVTNIPGTTRDTIRESVLINGIRFTFTDTAGLRETDNEVERIGVNRAREAIQQADLRLLLIDSSEQIDNDLSALAEELHPDLIILSKNDISVADYEKEIRQRLEGTPMLAVSSTQGDGLDSLRKWLVDSVSSTLSGGHVFSQTRHIEAAERAAKQIQDALSSIDGELPLDLIQIDLMEAGRELGEITGENVTEAVIDRVFNQFCVGK